MTLYRFRYYIEAQTPNVTAPVGTLFGSNNGTVIGDRAMPPSAQTTSNIEDGKTHTAKWNINLTGSSGKLYRQTLSVELTSVPNVPVKKLELIANAPFINNQTLVWNPVGRPDAPPTYLEQLAKLDQYSTAQYIPDEQQLRF